MTDRDGSAAFVSSRHVVGSLRSGRMVTSVAVCQFANIHGVVMEWVVNLRYVYGRLFCAGVCFTAVTVPHEPSRIVAVRANLATRLGSSRSANFFGGRCTLPQVHFRYPFSRHDFRCDGRNSRSRFVTSRHYPSNRHDLLRIATTLATRYRSGVLDMSGGQNIAIRSFEVQCSLPNIV